MSGNSEVMIQVTGLTKFYGTLKAVDNISFKLHRGEVLGFLGPNGAGKTTTMKILTCYFAPSSGRATVKGFDVFKNPGEVKNVIGYLPENAPLYGEMTPKEYLEFVAAVRAIPSEDIRDKIKYIADVCGLWDIMDREVRTLSKGYRQRVGLAQAMIHDPEIIILDEPTSGLDPKQIVEIRNLIKEIGKKKTIILSTHNLSEVQVTSNRVIIIHHGKIVADAPTDQIQQKMGRNKYRIVFAKNGTDQAAMMEKLKAMSGVAEVGASPDPEEGTISLDLDGKGDIDLRPALFSFAVEGRHKLLELRRERINLESVFMEMTQE
jgi:ABC-2 type transport system ATP-binding protein